MTRGLTLTINIKNMFFDRRRIIDKVAKANRRNLSKAGAFIRRSAKSSIRKRKRISRPGEPPSSHEGSLRRLIYFGYEPNRETVVIGPVRFGAGQAPALLERGGSTRLKRGNKVRIARYRPRPFMGPALEREAPKLAPLWERSIK